VNVSCLRQAFARSKASFAVAGESRASMPNGRRSSIAVQWNSGLPSVSGTVRAHASNFSQSEASPEQRRSGTPAVRIARHL